MSQYIRPPHDRPLPRPRHVAPRWDIPTPRRPRRRPMYRLLGRRLLRGLAGCAPAVWPSLGLIPLLALLASWWLGVL